MLLLGPAQVERTVRCPLGLYSSNWQLRTQLWDSIDLCMLQNRNGAFGQRGGTEQRLEGSRNQNLHVARSG
jgi:hypothetical protein